MAAGGRLPPNEEADYRAIESAVRETERGRWFLAEFARRHRASETSHALTALRRLSSAVDPAAPPTTDDGSIDHGEIQGRLKEIRAIIARANIVAQGNGRADGTAYSGAVAEADAAIEAIRKVGGRIQEVAFELGERGRLAVYSEALNAYALDLSAACARQDVATQRLSRLAKTLNAVERRLAGLMARLPLGPTAYPAETVPAVPRGCVEAGGTETLHEHESDIGWAESDPDHGDAPSIHGPALPLKSRAPAAGNHASADDQTVFLVNPS